jgi:hypothetical protein
MDDLIYEVVNMKKPKLEKKITSPVPIIGGVYRIPLRKVYNKNHIKGDATWDSIYGKKKCAKCRQKFQEGDAYRTTNDHKYVHVECS